MENYFDVAQVDFPWEFFSHRVPLLGIACETLPVWPCRALTGNPVLVETLSHKDANASNFTYRLLLGPFLVFLRLSRHSVCPSVCLFACPSVVWPSHSVCVCVRAMAV